MLGAGSLGPRLCGAHTGSRPQPLPLFPCATCGPAGVFPHPTTPPTYPQARMHHTALNHTTPLLVSPRPQAPAHPTPIVSLLPPTPPSPTQPNLNNHIPPSHTTTTSVPPPAGLFAVPALRRARAPRRCSPQRGAALLGRSAAAPRDAPARGLWPRLLLGQRRGRHARSAAARLGARGGGGGPAAAGAAAAADLRHAAGARDHGGEGV